MSWCCPVRGNTENRSTGFKSRTQVLSLFSLISRSAISDLVKYQSPCISNLQGATCKGLLSPLRGLPSREKNSLDGQCIHFSLLPEQITVNSGSWNHKFIFLNFFKSEVQHGSLGQNQGVSRAVFLSGGSGGAFISCSFGCRWNSFPLGCRTKTPCFLSAEGCPQLLEATHVSWLMTSFLHLHSQQWGVNFHLCFTSLLLLPVYLSPAGESALPLRIYVIKQDPSG